VILHPFNGLFSRTTWVSQYQKGKTTLVLTDARDNWVWDGSGISWTICKQPASYMTTPTPHHSTFTGQRMIILLTYFIIFMLPTVLYMETKKSIIGIIFSSFPPIVGCMRAHTFYNWLAIDL